jgi:hypothetical protein
VIGIVYYTNTYLGPSACIHLAILYVVQYQLLTHQRLRNGTRNEGKEAEQTEFDNNSRHT